MGAARLPLGDSPSSSPLSVLLLPISLSLSTQQLKDYITVFWLAWAWISLFSQLSLSLSLLSPSLSLSSLPPFLEVVATVAVAPSRGCGRNVVAAEEHFVAEEDLDELFPDALMLAGSAEFLFLLLALHQMLIMRRSLVG